MNKHIYVTRAIPHRAIQMLTEKGYQVDVNPLEQIPSQDDIITALNAKHYDGVIALLTDTVNETLFTAFPDIKIYANYATGFDNIDISAAKNHGITITNAPADLSSESVAEHTIALIFALMMRIVESDTFVRQGKYVGWSPMNFIGTDIAGKTLGLIGAGNIGKRVAQYGKALGMHVIYYDVKRNEVMEQAVDAVFCERVEDVLMSADVVSLHVPLLDSTKHLMNAERFAIMKPTSFLVNTSRGPIIDETALVSALQHNTIKGAALDVFEFEPKLAEGLSGLSNVILTPHIGSASEGARNQMAEIVAQNVIDFFEGRTPRNIVNP